jgi:uncharacterized damage-inducible protein DinB/predicted RNase H-like HicB family nuclease
VEDFPLYLESGPRRRKTMVHVIALPGCIANGPTTEAALDATPDAVRAYRRFLRRHGDAADPAAPFSTHVAEHITEGQWLGNGSPYMTYEPDFASLSAEELETFLQRFRWMREDLAGWAASQPDESLDAQPRDGGRTARAILLHVLDGPGGYLSPVVGGVRGFASVRTAAERGEIPLPEALLRVEEMASEVARATTPEQRSAVIRRPKEVRTLRKALRRMLEHDWEHVAELSRRPGGPEL